MGWDLSLIVVKISRSVVGIFSVFSDSPVLPAAALAVVAVEVDDDAMDVDL